MINREKIALPEINFYFCIYFQSTHLRKLITVLQTSIPAKHNPYGGACPPAALWSGRSHSLPHSPAGSFWGAAGLFAEGPPGAGMTRTVHPPHLASNPAWHRRGLECLTF